MRINLDILYDALNDPSAYASTNDSIALDTARIVLYGEDDSPRNDTAYLIGSDDFLAMGKPDPTVTKWIICGNVDVTSLPNRQKAESIVIPNAKANRRIIIKLNDILQHYAEYESTLMLSALKRETYKDVLSNIAYEELKTPFLLFNPYDLCVVAKGDLPAIFDNKEYRSLVESLETKVPTPGFKMGSFADNTREPYVFLETPSYSLMVANIFVGAERYGKIVFADTGRPFTKGFKALAGHLQNFMSILTQVAAEQDEFGMATNSFLHQLLSSKNVETEWYEYHRKFTNWPQETQAALIVSKPRTAASSTASPLFITLRMPSVFPRCESFVFQKTAVTLIFHQKGQSQKPAELAAALEKAFEGLDVVHGISQRFHNLKELRKYYLQCQTAVASLESDSGTERQCAFYDGNLFFEDFLATTNIAADSTQLLNPDVMTLWKHDRANNSNNVACLEAFIESGCSITNASAALFVHQNTLSYRLRRIKEISGLDCRDPESLRDNMFQILLTCKLLLRK